MTGIRVIPDNNDIVVWKLDEVTTPFVNSSTSTSAPSHATSDLSTRSGTFVPQQPSPFAADGTNSALQFTATNSSSPRNFISGASGVEPAFPLTISAWIYLRSYGTSGYVEHLFTKQHTAGVWSGGTFSTLTMQSFTPNGSTHAIYMNGTTGTVAYWTVPLNMWCHVGMTYDGSITKNYLNGTLVQQWATTGAINWGGHGPWFIGAIPAGSGDPEESPLSICDIRIANIARPLSYFQDVFKKGAMTSGNGLPTTTYYKLRAYDLACTTITPVYWISSFLNYSEAPTAPCGSINTLGPIEILETWTILG